MFEITPNPNALKLNTEHTFEVGMDYFEIHESNPDMINKILSIEGVSSIFVGPNFLTLLKAVEYDWKDIKTTIEELL